MKIIKFTILFMSLAVVSIAQNDIPYTHFIFNKMNYNPAYTGNKKVLDLTAIYRNQWTGVEGAPETGTFSVQLPFAGKRNAFGLGVTSDKIGKIENIHIDLSYAYHLKLDHENTLSIGLMGRLEQTKINWDDASPLELIDDNIPTGNETSFTPNFGFGLYYTGKSYYFGISNPRLLKNSLYLNRSDNNSGERLATTWYAMGGILIPLNRQIELAPSFLLSINPNAPTDLDLNANFIFLKQIWAGVSYRWGDSLDGMIGYEFNNGMRIGAAYDYTTSDLSKATTGSFEIMLGYTFQCKDCNVAHLRFF